ncbi:hypothetical protein IJI18_00260 [Candidatus Saccharibacteria bacterium]|nr:hypothetical protein [Candidatus Saccharibacteria bacterium]
MSGKLKKRTKKVEKSEKVELPKKVERVGSRPFDYKTWIWVLLAVAALILVIIAIVNFSQNEKFDSSYFHDDDKKIVLTMNAKNAELDNSDWEPEITHVVYYYDNNKIVNARVFYEYKTDAEAEEAYKNLALGEFATSKKISGRFVVFDVNKMQYENLTVQELRENIESLKGIGVLVLDYDQPKTDDSAGDISGDTVPEE